MLLNLHLRSLWPAERLTALSIQTTRPVDRYPVYDRRLGDSTLDIPPVEQLLQMTKTEVEILLMRSTEWIVIKN